MTPEAALPAVPLTIEGASVLHQMMRVRWSAWRALSATAQMETLDEAAKETGRSVPAIALNWLLQRPTVVNVVIGARNQEQLRQNLQAVGWNLTAEQVAKLDKASDRAPIYPYWHQRQFGERNPWPVPLAE